jgi:hypothetical protein
VAGSYAGQAGSYLPAGDPYAGQAGSFPPAGEAGALVAGAGGTIPVAGSGGNAPVGGAGGIAGTGGIGGAGEVGGSGGFGGNGGTGGFSGAGGSVGGSGGTGGSSVIVDTNLCCRDGNCLTHGTPPADITPADGPFQYQSYPGATGTIYYPTDAAPPFAGFALCGGLNNTGEEMQEWGPFYASWGIVIIITTTLDSDVNEERATKLLASIDELKSENNNPLSPLNGQMSHRYGTAGYSMGGGGTTIASTNDPTFKSSMGLAPFLPLGGMSVPTLFLEGALDPVAGAAPVQTAPGTPSLQVVFDLYSHFNWYGPTPEDANYALAWQKCFLEGDEAWRPYLTKQMPTANLTPTGL